MCAYEPVGFHYHADAFALSGEFVRPLKGQIEVQAGTSLPFVGGHGHASAEAFNFGEFVSFKKAYSHVSGSRNGDAGNHTTQTTSVLEGLNVLDVVTADRIVMRLSVDHDPKKREGHIITLGSKFENLRIAGCPVEIELDHDLFLSKKTIAELTKHVATWKKNGRMAKVGDDGVVLCSLAKSIKVDCPGITVDGHEITVEQFGKIYVAEVYSWKGTKSVCMLRFELGSPVEGTMVAAGGKANGTPFP